MTIEEAIESLSLLRIFDAPSLSEAVKMAVAALHYQANTSPNEPLTLEQLRGMDGEPYWHVGLQEDSPPPHWNVLDPFYAQHIEDYGYGKRWLAYRYELEGGGGCGD